MNPITRPTPRLSLARFAALGALGVPLLAGGSASHAQTYALTTLATFTGTNGINATGALTLDPSGNLYGTTTYGGSSGQGTIFKIATGTSNLTTLVNFNNTNGEHPDAGLTLDSSGNLFGTTNEGGSSGDGTVFKIAAGTNTVTTLAAFTGTANGQNPYAGLTLDSSGNLYGTTRYGGSSNDGTIFKIAAGTNTITTLYSFNGGADGATPWGGLTLDSSGNLYGTTYVTTHAGGSSNNGTVFKLATGTNTITTLFTFTGPTYGAAPAAGIVLDPSGNLYGTTQFGGSSDLGTVFRIAAGTNTLTTLATFTSANGAQPFSGLTMDVSGNLYGTTELGGSSNDGTIFKIAAGTGAFSTLFTFTGNNGAQPVANLTLDPNGNLYGTTTEGGSSNDGTVFKLSPVASAAAPEPSALTLLLPVGLPTLLAVARRRRRAASEACA